MRAVIPAEVGVLRLAGSGAFIPLARELAAAWNAKPGALRVVVEDSLGSGGGAAAAADGAVDLALLSRSLSAEESARGLRAVLVAFDAVVVGANVSVPAGGLTPDEVRALYSGAQRTFAGGAPAAVLLRDRGESANPVMVAVVPGLRPARDGDGDARPMRVLYSDAAMSEALAATPGAIGLTSLGLIAAAGPGVKALALDGRTPSLSTLEDGSWPARRPLSIAGRPERLARAKDFVDFVFSPEGAQRVRAFQALPVARP